MASAPTPLPNRLQTLPQEMQETLFSHLTTDDVCAMSGACRSLHKLISDAQAREPGYVLKTLAAYRSPGGGSREHLPALDQLDVKIHRLQERLTRIREDQHPDGPHDPAGEIAIERVLNTLRASRLPNDQFPRSAIDLIMDYYQDHSTQRTPCNVFGTKEWNTFIGQVPNRSLLPGIEALVSQPCSIFSGKRRDETHICIDIPPTVDGQPLTLRRILRYARENRGNQPRLKIYCDRILEQLGDRPIPDGQYVLLKTCLPDTKNKTHQDQLEVLARHPEYQEATLLQVLVASLMEHIQSGEAKTRLFEEEWARTSTAMDRGHLVFGGYYGYHNGHSNSWPLVHPAVVDSANDDIGLAVVLRSGGSSPVLGP